LLNTLFKRISEAKISAFSAVRRLPKLFSSATPGLRSHGRNFQLTGLASLTHTCNQAAANASSQQIKLAISNMH